MKPDIKSCLSDLPDCGRTAGIPICPKCGLDERVGYTTPEAVTLAKSQAQARYWQNEAQGLQAKLKQAFEPPAPPLPSGGYRVGDVFKDLPIAPQMVVLPNGSFFMGSADDDAFGYQNERPQHKVIIAQRLAMGRYPVTFEDWDACVTDGGVNHKPDDMGWGRGKRPVIHVNWEHAQAYAAWLNKKLGLTATDPARYRLPSEAEWEYACRAGTTGNFSTAAGQLSDNDATYDASFVCETLSPKAGNNHDKTTPVGVYAPNSWGLFDMHGNVFEWVQDDYEDSYQGAPADGSARTTGAAKRVLRGGSYDFKAWNSRSASRVDLSPGNQIRVVGFRLARTVL